MALTQAEITEVMQQLHPIIAKALNESTSIAQAQANIQQGVTQYIGARYVPLFADPIEWDKTRAYEPLTIVLYQGNSFTTRQYTPADIDINNDAFWAETGNYNAQIELYRKEVRTLDARITAAQSAADDANAKAAGAANAVVTERDRATAAEKAIADSITAVADSITAVADAAAYVNVVSKGVDNTGRQDAAAVLNELIKTGGQFYLPAGTYLLNSQLLIPSNTVIKGAGVDKTVLKAGNGLDAVYHTICSRNAADINARLARNVASDTAPAVDTVCPYEVSNITLMGFTVDGNWQGRNLNSWDHTWESPTGHEVTREPGTNIELQRVSNAVIERVKAINGIQHNFNVRGGSGGYGMGVAYIAMHPSHDIKIIDCISENERYDDGITTHDTYNVVIDSCHCSVVNNVNGTYSKPISNGIEIDDGSYDVVVKNCVSEYSFAGYQAKGHANTHPAHDVTFENCVAIHNMHGFDCGAGTATGKRSDPTNGCYNISITNCSVYHPYAFSNATEWVNTCYAIIMQNIMYSTVDNFTAYFGTDTDQLNKAQTSEHFIRTRDESTGLFINGAAAIGPANKTDDTLFMCFSGATRNVMLNNITLPAINKAEPLIEYANSSQYGYFTANGVYAVKTDTQASDIIKTVSSNVRGTRTDAIWWTD